MLSKRLILLLVAIQICHHLEDKLTQCNHIKTIKYDQRNGIDFYFADANNNQPNNPRHRSQNAVTTNFKSILPSNLARPSVGVLDPDTSSSGNQQLETSGLPQVANSLQIVRGNGPRGRSAKQLRLAADDKATNSDNVCLTPGCVKAAAEILKNIDERVEPCDDFYRYACGNWIESQIIPEDKTSVSLFSLVQDELDNKLRNLIERQNDKQIETPIVRRMRNLYDSCMNTSKYSSIDAAANYTQSDSY